MNITVFKRITIGSFLAFAEEMINSLPDSLRGEKDDLRGLCDEMTLRLNSIRINRPLRELTDKDMPRLRYLVRTLEGGLSLCESLTANDAQMLKFLRQGFKKRRNAHNLIKDAMILAGFDSPQDALCALVLDEIRNLVSGMDAKLLRAGEAEAEIKSIGSCIPVRNDAIAIIRRIKERAVAWTYEEDARKAKEGEETLHTLSTLIAMAERQQRKKRKKEAGADDEEKSGGENGKNEGKKGNEDGTCDEKAEEKAEERNNNSIFAEKKEEWMQEKNDCHWAKATSHR